MYIINSLLVLLNIKLLVYINNYVTLYILYIKLFKKKKIVTIFFSINNLLLAIIISNILTYLVLENEFEIIYKHYYNLCIIII